MAGKRDTKKAAEVAPDAPQTSDHQGEDLGASEVQAKVDAENEQGFRGTKVDPTPDENYTVAGVTSGAPTPETDAEAAQAAGSTRFAGMPEAAKEKK